MLNTNTIHKDHTIRVTSSWQWCTSKIQKLVWW